MRTFTIGSRWRVNEGSGLASNRVVTVIPWHNWRDVPGMYKAPNAVQQAAIQYEDTGEKGFMFKNRLVHIPYRIA